MGMLGCSKDIELTPGNENKCAYGGEFTILNDRSLSQEGLIPITFNNYWVYADTSWDENGEVINAAVDTVRAIKARVTDTDIWWTFSSVLSTIHQKDDTVFVLESTYPYGCLNKRLEYYPLTTDTIHTLLVIEGDIGVLKKTYQIPATVFTPAGDFDQCYYYRYSLINAEILKQGVGFIKLTDYLVGRKQREYTLIDYHLE